MYIHLEISREPEVVKWKLRFGHIFTGEMEFG